MNLGDIEPVVLYDNDCAACSSFAAAVDAISGGRFAMIGHYTPLGERLRGVLGEGATDMFWVISGGVASGGRAGLCALASCMLRARRTRLARERVHADAQECRSARSVLLRSASVITHSRTLRVPHGLNMDAPPPRR